MLIAMKLGAFALNFSKKLIINDWEASYICQKFVSSGIQVTSSMTVKKTQLWLDF